MGLRGVRWVRFGFDRIRRGSRLRGTLRSQHGVGWMARAGTRKWLESGRRKPGVSGDWPAGNAIALMLIAAGYAAIAHDGVDHDLDVGDRHGTAATQAVHR